jgi:hypothetical protein
MENHQLPTFQENPGYQYKVLPSGIHIINQDEFDVLFVNSFPSSQTRKVISVKLKNFLQLIGAIVPSEIWINGSFVESKENPSDVDVVVIVLSEDFEKLT